MQNSQQNILRSVSGRRFSALNPTPDTGIAQAVQATFSATAALLNIFNATPFVAAQYQSNLPIIIPIWIRLIMTVAPASATRMAFIATTDAQDRFSSGGSVLTPTQVISRFPNQSFARINFGAVVLTAESTDVRRIAHGNMRTQIPIVQDEYFFLFEEAADISSSGMNSATALRNSTVISPTVIYPGQSFSLQPWYAGNAVTPASYECEIGWREMDTSMPSSE
jgi:hypothetical protein